MTKKELKQKIAEMINSGKPKKEIFQTLVATGENTNTVATLIASHQSLSNYEENYGKVNILVTFMLFWAMINAYFGYFTGLKTSTIYAWMMAFFAALIPILYAYGLYKNYAKAYNIYIVLGLVYLLIDLVSFTKLPVAEATVNVTFSIIMLVYVWYVRSLLFPDFYFLSPKKVDDQYIFKG